LRTIMHRFDAAASAAAGAFAVVVLGATLHPWVPGPSWLDAQINVWLICFAGLYVALHVAAAAVERVAAPRAGRR
jgi:hypothetical protein